MTLKLSDLDLVSKLKALVVEERKAAGKILEYLREVDRRRLFAEYGCASLWEFCTGELGYSDGAAHRRIGAMRLLRELPEVKDELLRGEQTLHSLAQAQKFFKAEQNHQRRKLTSEQKREVLRKIQGQSSRKCERILLQLSSVPLVLSRPERERPLDGAHTELKLVVSDELLKKLKRIQALRSHASPMQSYADLLAFMADQVLCRLDPELKAKRTKAKGSGISTSAASEKQSPPALEVRKTRKRMPIPASIRRSIWLRDQGRCSWQHPVTGKACGTDRFIEIDHIRPVYLGGANGTANLRLLCRAHNQRAYLEKVEPRQRAATN